MAFRAVTQFMKNGRGMTRHHRSFASSTTVDSIHHQPKSRMMSLKADLAPVYIVAGFMAVALSMGAHTAKQQLVHSPGVQVSKKKRRMVQEVDYPDSVVGEADKFLNKSFLRKVAHIQDTPHLIVPASNPNPNRSREVESLKSVGA